MKRMILVFAAMLAVISMALAGCGGQEQSPTTPAALDETTLPPEEHRELVILFTGGLEDIFARDTNYGHIGYAALTAFRDRLEEEGNTVILVDGGDSLAPENSYGDADGLWDLVSSVGYDIRVPGNLELSEGMDLFLDRAGDLKNCEWIGYGISDDDIPAYHIVETEHGKVGFVGVSVNSEDLDAKTYYEMVQLAIDDAYDAGADYVICVGNLGTDPADTPFTAPEVIANTTGYVAFLDCGSMTMVEWALIRDKDDFFVPLCTIGRQFLHIGVFTLNLNDGQVSVEILSDLEEENKSIRNLAEDLLRGRVPEETEPPTTEATEPTE